MKRLRSKPVPITQEAFQRAYHTKSEETLQINKLAVGQGLTSRCRWKHEKRTNVCGGRAFFRYAAKTAQHDPQNKPRRWNTIRPSGQIIDRLFGQKERYGKTHSSSRRSE